MDQIERKMSSRLSSLGRMACILIGIVGFTARAQESSSLFTDDWEASWIMVPQTEPTGYGVYYFRKGFELERVPSEMVVHMSADNRYKLFVNERLVSVGSLRGDVAHWNYETVDLAPYLRAGRNIVAAQVWNEGEYRPEANISFRTGFILQGESSEAASLNTNESWKCVKDDAYAPRRVIMYTYYMADPDEEVDMRRHIDGWNTLALDDSQWLPAAPVMRGRPKNWVGFSSPVGWLLMPSPLPPMELTEQRIPALREGVGVSPPASFPKEKGSVEIPAHTKAEFLLDQIFLTNAYLTLCFSKGDQSSIKLGYQESLFTEYPHKGNRDEVDGKVFWGREDSIISNGRINQTFTTLAWRTFRYILVRVETQDEPLLLEDIYGTFTGYPFERKAAIHTENEDIQKILEIGWRTAHLCAVDTYMDCPYYEQLQYLGDTRIQALISLYNSGDSRLAKNFLRLMDWSRQPEGATLSHILRPTSSSSCHSPSGISAQCMII